MSDGWNYRLVKYEDCIGVVEAYYNERGEICGFTQVPIFVADDLEGLLNVMDTIRKDILMSSKDMLDPDMPLAEWGDKEWEDK